MFLKIIHKCFSLLKNGLFVIRDIVLLIEEVVLSCVFLPYIQPHSLADDGGSTSFLGNPTSTRVMRLSSANALGLSPVLIVYLLFVLCSRIC